MKNNHYVTLSVLEGLALCKEQPKILLLDVRTREERAEGFIPNSMHLELAEILAGKYLSLKPYSHNGIVLYCKAGTRSAQAAEFLWHQGFKKLWNIAGGILAFNKIQS